MVELSVLYFPSRQMTPMITEPGNMVIYVAGYPAIMGLQPLYFRDSELARRARIPAESAQTKKLGDTLVTASV
jgi:type IV secretion system protein VirD4